MEIREENKGINTISNKFLDFLTTIVEEQEQLRSEKMQLIKKCDKKIKKLARRAKEPNSIF